MLFCNTKFDWIKLLTQIAVCLVTNHRWDKTPGFQSDSCPHVPSPNTVTVILFIYFFSIPVILIYQAKGEGILCLTLFCIQSLVFWKSFCLSLMWNVLISVLVLEWNHQTEYAGLGERITGIKERKRVAWRQALCLFLLIN